MSSCETLPQGKFTQPNQSKYCPQGTEISQQILDTMIYEDNNIMAYEHADWFGWLWQKRIALTINANQVPSTQTDFPLLINSEFDSLIGKSLAELRFTKADNALLDYEIQSFDSINGKLIAWTRMPTIADGDIINIYYDNPSAVDAQNPSAVWDSNYSGVYHMTQSSGQILDSTINARNGTPAGTPIYSQAGKIGDAILFNGTTDKFDLSADITVLGNGIRTMSAWARTDEFKNGGLLTTADIGTPDGDFSFRTIDVNLRWRVQLWDTNDFDTTLVGSDTGFHHYAVVYDGTDVILYYDGDEASRSTVPLVTIPGIAMLGLWRLTMYHKGIIDEPHFSTINKSSDFIKTEFNNQSNPDAFYSIGAEENRPDESTLDIMRYEA